MARATEDPPRSALSQIEWPTARSPVIRDAALQLFWERGYHGTSMRQIGKGAGIAVANVYHYYPSKLDLLFEIVDQATDVLAASTEESLRQAAGDPVSQLAAVVAAHVRFHIEFQRESFVGNSELRSLPARDLKRYIAKRDAQQGRFKRPLVTGVEQEMMVAAHPHEAVLAMITMCTSVALWYRADGGLTPEEIVQRFVALALRMVGASRPLDGPPPAD